MGGSPTTFDELFEEHFTYVWHTLRRLGVRESEREDLVQEVFVRVHQAMPTYDATRPPRRWLFAFAFRLAADYRRLFRHKAEVFGPLPEEVPLGAKAADVVVEETQRRAVLQRALDVLDLDRRAVVILHELEEMPIPEVARTLGIPEGTAYSRLRSARIELRATLERLHTDAEEGT